jgi:hypothetical protein
MYEEICVFNKEISNSKLLALFNTLADGDKDIVIKMAELLVQKWKLNITNNIDNKKISRHCFGKEFIE